MKKRLVPAFFLVVYSAVLIKVMVFKSLPTIKIDQLLFNFGGTDGGAANFVPFKTIGPYFFGNQGVVIAGVNLLGNVALLVPIGLLAPLVFRNITWKKSLVLAASAGLTIEIMQAVLRLGIFDIDDVILNALGVMTGYWIFLLFAKWIRARNYKYIAITVAMGVVIMAGALYVLYPKGRVVNPNQATASGGSDPCDGTRGTGEITNIGMGTIIIKRNDNSTQTIMLTNRTVFKNSKGPASKTDLRTGQRVTVVVDDSEAAADVLVCKVSDSEIIHR